MKCLSCAAEIPDHGRACPSCGAALDGSFAPTRPLDIKRPSAQAGGRAAGRKASAPTHTSFSADSIDNTRFVAGTILAERFRIVGLLGRGGMGEVYRADDLVLKQPVALKFLPEAVSHDSAALERFRREVRVARQISHPNVCRVYDVGESEGLHFLSMEFIRGEELASALRRFGRLPADRAVEVARQVCAGLAAAHKGGVLHRDLKPANVMLDEHGAARITDFGLAALAEELRDTEVAGTPAYMSPEQLEGRELTTRSDIYSLGLVLYELFTGRRAFDAPSLPELLRLRRGDAAPPSPSSHVTDLDPLVERVILRCLEKDTDRRPASALAVAAALPGGDPLQAALAMGETPSPEMVAAAPKEGTLRPAAAVACLAAVLAGLALVALLSGRWRAHRLAPLDTPPEVLRARAAEVVRRLGYADAPADDAYGFTLNATYLLYAREHDRSPVPWGKLKGGRPAAIVFWYRQSPYDLVPVIRLNMRVRPDDPPPLLSGMSTVFLEPQGRLFRFVSVPPQIEESSAPAGEPDWPLLFAEAGLDFTAFTPAVSKWVPPVSNDVRRAWEGAFPEQPETPIRVEAAGYRGRPVYFQIIGPWTLAERMRDPASGRRTGAFEILGFIFLLAPLTAGVLLARHNLRSGRGDHKGAFRLAVFAFILGQLSWAIGFDHVSGVAELDAFLTSTARWSFTSGVFWLTYVAFEPYVRRRWPHRIISWSRLLAGDWRDPLVGRDVLVGGLCGVAGIPVAVIAWSMPGWLGLPPNLPLNINPPTLLGLRNVIAEFLGTDLMNAILTGLGLLFLLLLLHIVLRRAWLASGVLCLILTLYFGSIFDNLLVTLPFGVLWAALAVFVLTRLGLLGLISFFLFSFLCIGPPLTSDFSAWYAEGSLFALAVALALALYGFLTALAGQPLWRGRLLED